MFTFTGEGFRTVSFGRKVLIGFIVLLVHQTGRPVQVAQTLGHKAKHIYFASLSLADGGGVNNSTFKLHSSAESHDLRPRFAWQAWGMRIVVCVKHVPDADGERRIEDGRLVRGEDDVLNELDEYAIEAGVSAVEDHGGEVIAVTMGPEDSEDALTRALQMGASSGLLITDENLEAADALGTATVLSAAVKMLSEEKPVDLVLTGMASLDGMTSMVPPAMATLLGWPLLDVAEELEVAAGDEPRVTIKRYADGYEDVLWADVPAVVSVTDQINEPRYPTFRDLRAARSKPVDEVRWQDLLQWAGEHADELARTRVVEATPRERETGTVVNDSGDGGTRLAQYLFEQVSI